MRVVETCNPKAENVKLGWTAENSPNQQKTNKNSEKQPKTIKNSKTCAKNNKKR